MSVSSPDDRQMDIAIGHILRIGVSVAASVVLYRLDYVPRRGPGSRAGLSALSRAARLDYSGIASILHGVGALDSLSIMQAGVLLLIATPVLRVVFCVAAFAARKDARYVLISGIVLAVLIYSLFFRA